MCVGGKLFEFGDIPPVGSVLQVVLNGTLPGNFNYLSPNYLRIAHISQKMDDFLAVSPSVSEIRLSYLNFKYLS